MTDSHFERTAGGHYRLRDKPRDMSPDAEAKRLEDAVAGALARERRAQMTPTERAAAELDDAKARLSAATADVEWTDLEAPAKDWDPDDWQAQGDDSEPEEGMVSVLDKLGMLR